MTISYLITHTPNLYAISNLSTYLARNTFPLSRCNATDAEKTTQKIFNDILNECGLQNIPCKIIPGTGQKIRVIGPYAIGMTKKAAESLEANSTEARRSIKHELANIYNHVFIYRLFVKTVLTAAILGLNHYVNLPTAASTILAISQIYSMRKIENYIDQRIEQRAQIFITQH